MTPADDEIKRTPLVVVKGTCCFLGQSLLLLRGRCLVSATSVFSMDQCNIRVIPGTHHAHNRTLTITFRCYVIIAMNLCQPLLKVLSKSLCLLRCFIGDEDKTDAPNRRNWRSEVIYVVLCFFYRGINKQLSQVVDTLFASPIINSNNKYTLLLFIYIISWPCKYIS
jgi:hypothetical protein